MSIRSGWLVLCMMTQFALAQTVHEDARVLYNLMRQKPDQFKAILDKKKQFELQIIYTQINRDSENRPSFKTFEYNVDTNRYFYPASTVKLPAVLLAFEKLRELNRPEINKYTPIYFDSVYSSNHVPTIA